MMKLWHLSRRNLMFVSRVVSDDDWDQQVAIWINGRVCGRYVSITIPWRQRMPTAQ